MSEDSLYYKVSYSTRAIESAEAIGQRAQAVGRREEVRIALQHIDRWLQADPETLGEPFREHAALEQTEFLGSSGPLIVRYNVHRSSKQVFVMVPIQAFRNAGF
jgi:hypothetical protein